LAVAMKVYCGLLYFFASIGNVQNWHMILGQVWHFFGHLQQQIMLLLNVLGETRLYINMTIL